MEKMYWETLNFTKTPKPRKIEIGKFKAVSIEMEHGWEGIPKNKLFIGIDPGVHYGITLISSRIMEIIYGKLPKLKTFTGMESVNLIKDLINEYQLHSYRPDDIHVFVEGAAFRTQYGQTKLEQVRFGFVVGFSGLLNTDKIKYIPPSSARKLTFGNGNMSGKTEWLMLNENAADSVVLALAALTTYKSGDIT